MTLSLTIILSAFEDTFFTWALNNSPALVSMGVLIWFTWWIRGEFIDYRNRFVKAEVDIIRLDKNQQSFGKKLKSFGKRLRRVEIKLDNLEVKFDNLDRKLDNLVGQLSATIKINQDSFKDNSPIELTEIGTKILVDMGGKNYIDSHLTLLLTKMEKRTFKSALDVQNYSIVLLNEKFNDDGLIPVRNYLFVTPSYKVDDTKSIPLNMSLAINLMESVK